jgi:transcriptional regulator with XRE-family HTH domain
MNAARALRVARTRAGLSQSELARNAAVLPSVVNRIERGKIIPRVDTLERLLAAAGATLMVTPRQGMAVARTPIRELLRMDARDRLARPQIETLDELCRRRVRFVVVGDAAARLHGAPIDVSTLEIVAVRDHLNLGKLERILQSPAVSDLVAHTDRPHDVWQRAEELPWLPSPSLRVLNRWIDAPTGFLASIDDLLVTASHERRDLLHAVQQEIDALIPGLRVYRDPDRQEIRLPLPPRRFRSARRSIRRGLSQIDRAGNL